MAKQVLLRCELASGLTELIYATAILDPSDEDDTIDQAAMRLAMTKGSGIKRATPVIDRATDKLVTRER